MAMRIATARDAALLFAPHFAEARGERLMVAHFAGDGRLLALCPAGEGTASVALPLRSIFGEALRLGADALLVAHNHPSGDPSPSPADIAATRRLAATAAGLGIRVHDHLVFAGSRCRSFRALGLI